MSIYESYLNNGQIVHHKKRFRLIIISLRKNFLTIAFCTFTLFLIIFSKSNLVAVKDGLKLWATAVVPSLFPFFVATELLSYTNVVAYLGKLFSKIIKPIFGVPRRGCFCIYYGNN